MTEKVRGHDQYRDSTGQVYGTAEIDILVQPLGTEVVTDPDPVPESATFPLALKAATADLTATNCFTFDNDMTITAVSFTPSADAAAPTAGNGRTWLLKGLEGTLATLALTDASDPLVEDEPVAFTINHAAIAEEQILTIEHAHTGTGGYAVPAGTLSITATF